MVNSKAKGGRGEREFAKFLQEKFGISARRGIQFAGGPDSPDIVTDIDGVHFEIKRQNRTDIYKWMAQAAHDARDNDIPCVAFRRDRDDWLVCIKAKNLVDFGIRVMEVATTNLKETKDENVQTSTD